MKYLYEYSEYNKDYTKIHDFDVEEYDNNSLDSGKTYGYHITRRENLDSIKNNGLEPRVPLDYGETGDIKGIYFFKTLKDTKTALYQWLGERIDEWEEEYDEQYDEICLKVDLTEYKNRLIDSVEYEWIYTEKIPFSKIIKISEI